MDGSASAGADDFFGQDFAGAFLHDHHVYGLGDALRVGSVAVLKQGYELFKDEGDLLCFLALHLKLGAAHSDVGVGEGCLYLAEMLVALAEQTCQQRVVGN